MPSDSVNSRGPVRCHFHVEGVVQGVGFRPFVYGLATRLGLTGWVLNTSSGVQIEVQGAHDKVRQFEASLTAEAPPLARIRHITTRPLPIRPQESGFAIHHSEVDSGTSLISPDVATCTDCLHEILDPGDRRYRYPFTNCTNCGPRYTIIQDMPYDRSRTTMSGFKMCADCLAEYLDPLNRRFHAQPNACPRCGPQIRLIGDLPDPPATFVDDIARAAALLRAGKIVAVKGLGGFHLACDATNSEAVARLRERKHRPDKPLAIMMASLTEVQQHCSVSSDERDLLTDPSAPIVLLYRLPGSTVATNVAPRNPMLGVMLPYTPLHHLLIRDAGCPLVMTSGNIADHPVLADEQEALSTLKGIADAFLIHNRAIHMRCDDAIWWVDRFAGEHDAAHQPLRRARGDAPYPIRLAWTSRQPIVAVGAEMKNTLCLTRGSDAFLSQHIGEVNSWESLAYFQEVSEHLQRMLKITPAAIACDMHPGYLTSRQAEQWSTGRSLPLIAVQHHHAHIAACLAEYGRAEPVIGIAFDGTGYGPDGAIWGGEVLVADPYQFERAAHLEYLPLPGGEAAIRRPYRTAWAYLLASLGYIPDLPGFQHLPGVERHVVERQVDRKLNTPLTSSCGRLFDAISAMLGLCREATFEAQAAIALELAAREYGTDLAPPYPFEIDSSGQIRLRGLLTGVVADMQAGAPPTRIASAFHATLVAMATEVARWVSSRTGLSVVALSGGVFQNRLLLQTVRAALRSAGFSVLTHRQVPANDGGLSLGQAVVAMHLLDRS